MDKKERVLISIVVLIILVMGFYFLSDWISRTTGYTSGESEVERVVTCLNNKNAELYDSFNCKECEEQARLFGNNFKELSIVDCGNNLEKCKNIREVPAWYVNGKIEYGFKSLDELKILADC